MYRFVIQKGIVVCSEFHQLFDKYTHEKLRPVDVNVGHELFHRYIKRKVKTTNTTNIIEERQKAFYKKFEDI